MYYTIRVELHGAHESNYQALHFFMEAEGFSRTIVADDGRAFKLPPAEYSYVGKESQDVVLAAAKRAANHINLKSAVLVTSGNTRIWDGLEPVGVHS